MPDLVDTTPARLDIKAAQLTPWVLSFLCVDANNQPIDFSGCSAVLHVTLGPSSSWECTTANGKLTISGGTIQLLAPLEDMQALPLGRFPYHLIVTTATGVEMLPFVFSGLLIIVSGEVT